MKKQFALGMLFGVIGFAVIGATATLISGYPDRGALVNADYFLVDTGTNYAKVNWLQIHTYTDDATNQVLATATTRITASTNSILTDPTITGSLTITGGTGTNDLNGVNNVTNVNGVTLSWKTNDFVFGDGTTNTVIYLGL